MIEIKVKVQIEVDDGIVTDYHGGRRTDRRRRGGLRLSHMKTLLMLTALSLLGGCASVLNSDFVRWASAPRAYYQSQGYQQAPVLAPNGQPVYQQAPALTPNGQPIYDASQCIGAVVNGVCHGSTMGQPVARCYGTMINGQCTGPQF
ncbi:hypothetical protein SA496_20175 [Pseudomonas sp. JS3066]|uniref:hypothetical protein n=1 Tax=Pseudomonas sp. JS3066 TaxID=3090665 RepID=UPI002E7B769E|nr:hypothetical protein [Pseudomonas sp. JS3066]WVK92019.1 hypothetical protein SA496_20175 [Pseudomonas sp. JS3066]